MSYFWESKCCSTENHPGTPRRIILRRKHAGIPTLSPMVSERRRRTRLGILRRLDPRSSSDACSSGVHLRNRAAPRMPTISKLSDLSDPSAPSGSSSNGHSEQVKSERNRDMSGTKISTADAPSRRAETTREHDGVSFKIR